MNARAFAVYQESQREATVDQASPLDLVILTYERIIHHCDRAAEDFQRGHDSEDAVTSALNLISDGLQSCLDFNRGGAVAENLGVLYEWAASELVRSRIKRDAAGVVAVRSALKELLGGWRALRSAN